MYTSNATLFSANTFTPIMKFDSENPLDPRVESDHAEICLKVHDKIINVWNISNPAYHCYFKYGDNPPFKDTHLMVDKPFSEGKMDTWLENKIKSQVDTIAERFVRGEVAIQVVVEGFKLFYEQLSKKILDLGHKDFTIANIHHFKPNSYKPEWNATGILINTALYKIENLAIYNLKYYEEGVDQEKDLDIPVACVREKSLPSNERRNFAILGVHVSGCKSQYPKIGLEKLAMRMKEVYEWFDGVFDVIAAGDFNSPPENVKKSLVDTLERLIGQKATLLQPTYPTHVNPSSQACSYDLAVHLGRFSAQSELLSEAAVSPASQSLISSIEKSRIKYLEKQGRLISDENKIN